MITTDIVLSVRELSKTYGSGPDAVTAIGDISLDVRRGELVCVVGPSGCGKTTLLRMLSGLLAPTTGRLLMNGAPLSGTPDSLALVFQDYSRSLYPWMTIQKNVELPLRRSSMSRAERASTATEALASVGLGDSTHLYPWQLSGGMQQRAAIARALAYSPEILLMDEPFAAVDAQTRGELEDLVLRLQADFGMTVLFVTHDIDESVYMGDRVVVLGPRPTSVLESIDIALPKPRDQLTTKSLPEFVELRSHVYERMHHVRG